MGDQLYEVKLTSMDRQVVCVVLVLSFLSCGWGQNRNLTAGKMAPGKEAEAQAVANEDITPTPRQMQNFLWRTLVMKDLRLRGQVQSGNSKIPLLIRTKERLLQFEFQDRPLQIRVRFAPEGSLIQKRGKADGEWEVVTGAEKTKAVAGTDLAYEDLGIDFLRWPDPQPKGDDNVMMLDCWVYEVVPPVQSNYAKVRYWISKGYKAMIRADGLNSQG
ncbi:outer membrane lipoprotein-sorting protein, partial [bacterium]|nr:outer membrane lipoprotein-sorting protein [bacterium]